MNINRRDFLKISAALATTLAAGCATTNGADARGRVVVIGGGFGGATAAKYLKKWAPGLDVTLVERNARFVSCPISNLVLAGVKDIDDITLSYDGLKAHGVRLVRDEALAIDPDRRQVRLASGDPLPWERLIVAPGIDFLYDRLPGLASTEAQARVPHAWKAGPQTVALRRRLQDLRNGGTFVISVSAMPYRCPPGPFERASLVAEYFKRHKPRSKILILDANPDIVSKKALFLEAWSSLYPGIIEYRPNSEVVDFDLRRNQAVTEFDEVGAISSTSSRRSAPGASPRRWSTSTSAGWVWSSSVSSRRRFPASMSSATPSPPRPRCRSRVSWPTITPRWRRMRSSPVSLGFRSMNRPSLPTPATASSPPVKPCMWPRSTSSTPKSRSW